MKRRPVNRPLGVFVVKYKADEILERYKAMLVAKDILKYMGLTFLKPFRLLQK